jgi:SAM-dependent methyltransferase
MVRTTHSAPIEPSAYDEWFESALGRRVWGTERRALEPALRRLARATVLDAGCGDGRLAVDLASRGAEVVGLDASERMLVAARDRAARAGVQLRRVQAEAHSLPFPDGCFDLVCSVTVLCFATDPGAVIRELARVLRPGGRLVLGALGRFSTWALARRWRGWLGDPLWRDAHFWRMRELEELVAHAGLSVVHEGAAVYFPRSTWAARAFAPLDPFWERITPLGAAFLVVAADKRPKVVADGDAARGGGGVRGE